MPLFITCLKLLFIIPSRALESQPLVDEELVRDVDALGVDLYAGGGVDEVKVIVEQVDRERSCGYIAEAHIMFNHSKRLFYL